MKGKCKKEIQTLQLKNWGGTQIAQGVDFIQLILFACYLSFLGHIFQKKRKNPNKFLEMFLMEFSKETKTKSI